MTDDHHARDISKWYTCVYLPWSGGGDMTDDHYACDISQWYTGVCTCPGLGEVS